MDMTVHTSCQKKKAVLKAPNLGRKTTSMHSIDFHNLVGQNATPVFLFGDCLTCHSELSLAISLLKFSTSLAKL